MVVLLVGGEPELLTILRSTFRPAGVAVGFARDAAEACVMGNALTFVAALVAEEPLDSMRREAVEAALGPDCVVLRVDRDAHVRHPSIATVNAWFSSPPEPDEVVDFIRRFFPVRG